MEYIYPIMNLKNAIEGRMKECGLNMNSLAVKAGLSDSSLVKNILYEKSENPRIDTMCKIADALECSIDELCGRSQNYVVSNEDLWIKSIEKVDELIQKTGKIISSQLRARLYLGCYELNSLNLEVKDESQLNLILKFMENKK